MTFKNPFTNLILQKLNENRLRRCWTRMRVSKCWHRQLEIKRERSSVLLKVCADITWVRKRSNDIKTSFVSIECYLFTLLKLTGAFTHSQIGAAELNWWDVKKHYRSYCVLWCTGVGGVMIIITGESTDCSPPPAALGNMGDIFTAQVTTTINITTSHL